MQTCMIFSVNIFFLNNSPMNRTFPVQPKDEAVSRALMWHAGLGPAIWGQTAPPMQGKHLALRQRLAAAARTQHPALGLHPLVFQLLGGFRGLCSSQLFAFRLRLAIVHPTVNVVLEELVLKQVGAVG